MKNKFKIGAGVLAVLVAVAAILVAVYMNNDDNTPVEPQGNAAVVDATDLDAIKAAGKMVIGITEYEPMNYKDAEGEWTGFDTEYAQLVCDKLGVEADFIVIDWDNKFLELDAKSIDCIWNGMTITDEVTLNADVTNAYVKNAQVVVTNADVKANYTTIAEMTDLTFAAEAGSAGEAAIVEAGLDCTSVSDQASALMEVASGSVDACVIDITMANAMTGEGTSYAELVQAEELAAEEYGIACRKGSDLTAEINSITDELKADGTLDKLAEKYELALVK